MWHKGHKPSGSIAASFPHLLNHLFNHLLFPALHQRSCSNFSLDVVLLSSALLLPAPLKLLWEINVFKLSWIGTMNESLGFESTSHTQPAVSGAVRRRGGRRRGGLREGGQKKNHLSVVLATGSVGLIRTQAHQLCFYRVTSQLRDWLLWKQQTTEGLDGTGQHLLNSLM